MNAGEISEKLEALDAQMAAAQHFVQEARDELAKPDPEVAVNGVVVARGDEARRLLEQFLDLAKSMEGIVSDCRRQFGH